VTSPSIDPLAAPPEERPDAGWLAARQGTPIGHIRAAAEGCQACDLYARATQVVFGEGPVPARLMLVGEQPGDQEDLSGRPFVGPAGTLLARALETAGIDRERAFVTNVVKHFKWRPSGKRRLHEKPNKVEVGACLPWVRSELELVRPEVLVLLGATAAGALLGPKISVTKDRGRPLPYPDLAPTVMATVHPSSILRAGPGREAAHDAFIDDLRAVAELLGPRAA
jgi:uracil-DNA glycosylase family protein